MHGGILARPRVQSCVGGARHTFHWTTSGQIRMRVDRISRQQCRLAPAGIPTLRYRLPRRSARHHGCRIKSGMTTVATSAARQCHWNSSPQPFTCAGSAPAARSMPHTVVLTVSSSGMPSSPSMRAASGAARRLVQNVVMAPRPVFGHFVHQGRQRLGLDRGEVVVDANAQVALGHGFDADGAVVGDYLLLHVVGVRRDERDADDLAQGQQLVQRQHRGGGGNARAFADALAQPPVGVEAEPAGGGAAPADHVDLGIGQQFGRCQDLAVVELAERAVVQRDLRHLETRKVGARARHGGHDGTGERLERGIG